MTIERASEQQRVHGASRLAACALLCVVSLGLTSLPSAHLSAQSPESTVHAEVVVILGSEVPGVVAPELSSFAALREPPFSTAFRSMTRLASHPLEIEVGRPVEVALPNGRTLSVSVDAPSADGRYPTRVSISSPGPGSDYLPLLSVAAARCVPNFVVGQRFGGGTLIIGFRIGERCPS